MIKTKKLISLLLTVLILTLSLSVGTFAAETPFYVVLGDSIAYGSGLANPTETPVILIIQTTLFPVQQPLIS